VRLEPAAREGIRGGTRTSIVTPRVLRGVSVVAFLLVSAGCARSRKDPEAPCARANRASMAADPEWEARDATEKEFIRTHPSTISQDEAVAMAEEFVRAQGYTDQAPTEPLRLDIMEDRDTAAGYRHDSLEPRAVGVRRRARYWEVAFRVTESKVTKLKELGSDTDRDRGRAVGISIDGRKRFMQHQNVCVPLFDEP
jgi:hypothetical protein